MKTIRSIVHFTSFLNELNLVGGFLRGSEMNVPLCTPASLSHSYLECGLQLQL
jgi:hypothetical protein